MLLQKFWTWVLGASAEIGELNEPSDDPLMDAFNSAMADVGKGEQPRGSNGGPYVEKLRTDTGLPRRGGGEWCAVFVSAHLQRFGLAVGSRGAPGIAKAVEKLPGGRRVTPDELVPGRVYIAVRRRGLTKHHVQMFLVVPTLGGSMFRHVGGNEKHRVQTRLWQPARFLRGVKKIVTYDKPGVTL